jgi:hypothetical protein
MKRNRPAEVRLTNGRVISGVLHEIQVHKLPEGWRVEWTYREAGSRKLFADAQHCKDEHVVHDLLADLSEPFLDAKLPF